MKKTVFALALRRWPYGLELQESRGGLVLRPRRRARVNWAGAFRPPLPSTDDLAATRQMANEFDRKEWEW